MSLDGSRYRIALNRVQKYIQDALEAGKDMYVSEKETKAYNIVLLEPLSWDPDPSEVSDKSFSVPMPADEFDMMIKHRNKTRKAAWREMVKSRDMRCGLPKNSYQPWIQAAHLNLRHSQGRCSIGEEMCGFFKEQLKTMWYESHSLIVNGGWRPITDSDERQYRGWIPNGDTKFKVLAMMHPNDQTRHNNRAWCVVADGNSDPHTEPDGEQLLRCELVSALRIARNRIKRDKTYRHAVYPITILSISMFHVRILQVHLDPAGKSLFVRKTPYLHLESRSCDNVKLVLRWHLGQSVGDTTGNFAEPREEGGATIQASSARLQVPSIIITGA